MKYAHILAEISRQHWAITHEAMQGILDALDVGLTSFDRPKFHNSEIESIVSLLGERYNESQIASVRESLGIVQINGPIIPRGDAISASSGVVSFERLTTEFKALEADESINRILFVIDSPGGSVVGTSEFASLVRASSKPTSSYVYGFAASAAYWIASATDEIIAGDTGLVGSIGTVLSVARRDKDSPVTEIVSSQSPKKRIDPGSKDGRAELQTMVDGLADVFIKAVADNRYTTPDDVISNFGKGGLVLAEEAFSANMIDGIMTLADYLKISGSLHYEVSENLDGNYAPVSLSKVQNRIDKNPRKNEKQKKKDFNKTGDKNMTTLKELLSEHPEAASEVDELVSSANAAGVQTATEKHQADVDAAAKILNSNEYPETIKTIALDVIKGDKEKAQLETAVAVYDGLKASKDLDTAAEDSAEVPPTPSQQNDLSQDGVVRTEADIDAAVAEMKAR
jgi:ClpP class serine protease